MNTTQSHSESIEVWGGIELTHYQASTSKARVSTSSTRTNSALIMSEGGIFPWKLQKIKQPKNGLPGTCGYTDLSKPLPDPPKDQMWVQDEDTKEWNLVPVADTSSDAVAVARLVDTTDAAAASELELACTAIPVAVMPATAIKPNTTAAGIRYHEVLPTDTFQGICLRHKVTPMELRRANKMLGSNLKLAPSKLVIPTNNRNENMNKRSPTKEEKIVSLLSKVSRITENKLSYSEARAYLDIADWDIDCAIENVNEDFDWSSGQS